MMTDTSSQSAVAPVVPRASPDDAKATDPPVALRAFLPAIGTCELYYKYLLAHILKHAAGSKARALRHYEGLATHEAMTALAFIWKESPGWISDVDLACAKLGRSCPDGVTRHSLGSALKAADCRPPSLKSDAMFARRASRIVQAAMACGLVEEEVRRSNCKPLHATKGLHDLMCETGSAAAVLSLAPDGHIVCGLSRPPDGSTSGGAT